MTVLIKKKDIATKKKVTDTCLKTTLSNYLEYF